MPLPTTLPASGKSNSTGAGVSPALPTGIAAGDLCFLVASTIAGATISITTNGGSAWTPLGTGHQDVTGGEHLYVWYRIHQAGDSVPTVTPSSDHICATCYGYHGVDTTTPVEAVAWSSEATSDTSYSYNPGNSTTINNCIVGTIYSSGVDSNTGQGGTVFANASLTNVTLLAEYETTSGLGGGFVILEGDKVTAGTTGTWSDTMVSATPKSYVSFAVRPVALVDADTISGITTPSGSDVADYVGAATISGVTTVTSDEVKASSYTDSATAGGVTTPSSSDTADYVGAAIISAVTTPSTSDISAGVDSATTSGITTPSYVGSVDFVDVNTIVSTSSITVVEVSEQVDTAIVVGLSIPSTSDVAGYVDSATPTGITTPATIEVSDYADISVVSGTSSPATVELLESIDAATVNSVTTVSASEIYTPNVSTQKAYPISDTTATGWSASTGTDLYACIDETTPSDTDYIYATAT